MLLRPESSRPSDRGLCCDRFAPTPRGLYVLAFGLTWEWVIPAFAVAQKPLLGPWVILGPSLAGFIMAGVTEGRAGMAVVETGSVAARNNCSIALRSPRFTFDSLHEHHAFCV